MGQREEQGQNPLYHRRKLTSRHHADWSLQKVGHADLVETPNGEWYAVHLCGRPLSNRNPQDAVKFPGCRRYPLGRETAIQKMRWTSDQWLELEQTAAPPTGTVSHNGGMVFGEALDYALPAVEVTAPDLPEHIFPKKPARDDFNEETLGLEYQSLRIPMTEEYISLKERPGWLRMYGHEGLASLFRQTLIARRWTEFQFTASTCLAFEPDVFKQMAVKQMAGLICMYDTENYL